MKAKAKGGVRLWVLPLVYLAGVVSLPAHATGPMDYELLMQRKAEGYKEDAPWVEGDVVLPEAPRDENLLPIDAGPMSSNRFLVDETSVVFGSDSVIRYTMVVASPSGARNVSFEGMRCDTAERRVYAFGRSDGSWSKARNSAWARIENRVQTRHHAVLYGEYFCTPGGSVMDTASAKRALRKGNSAAYER